MDSNWLRAFSQMTYGIYVLTARHADQINGMIASWVTQVSYEPPLIMAAVHPHRFTHALIEKSQRFALQVVHNTHTEILGRMKGPDPAAKFAGIDWEPGPGGCPILKDCLAWFECEVKDRLRPGNHTLFIAQVVNAASIATGRPFCTLDYKGTYVGDG